MKKKIFKVRGKRILVSNGQNDIYISNVHKEDKGENVMRPSPLSNPYAIGFNGNDRQEILAKYRYFLYEKIRGGDTLVIRELQRLFMLWETKGELTLKCCCAPAVCHAEVIAEILINEKENR